MANSPTITITVGEYEVLLEASENLAALEAAGVDNWEGYGDAMASFYDDDDNDEGEDGR